MARVFERKRTLLDVVLAPGERLLYRLTGVDAEEEMRWTEYGGAMLLFSVATLLLTYAIERLQHAICPGTRSTCAAVEPALALEHGGLVHDQHELAVLRAGNDDELSDADARAGDA